MLCVPGQRIKSHKAKAKKESFLPKHMQDKLLSNVQWITLETGE